MTDSIVDKNSLRVRLESLGLSQVNIDLVAGAVPDRAIGILLYGSQARGDSMPGSDVDILVLASHHARSRSSGDVNVSTYDIAQLTGASGTLFGMHLARDGHILHDSAESLRRTLSRFTAAEQDTIYARVRQLGVILNSSAAERVKRIDGLTRLARYLLRTALYARALNPGPPCFSVSELAERFGDPELTHLLSSRPAKRAARMSDLCDLEQRLTEILGPFGENRYQTLDALIVAEWAENEDLANSALLALAADGSDLPYSEIPRVIL